MSASGGGEAAGRPDGTAPGTEPRGGSGGRSGPSPVRRLLATVLACEAIVIGLAIPVAVAVLKVDGAAAGAVCGGLAVACLVMAGLLRFRWAVPVGTAVQVLVIATGFMVPTMFFLGVLFGVLWLTAIWMGRKAEAARSR